MAEKGSSEAAVPVQQFPPASAAVWTEPADVTSESGVVTIIPSQGEQPQPSAPDLSELPPNYFDISIVPNNVILHYNEVVPYTEPSKAAVVREEEGIMTLDELVDKNPDQLWLYFMTYLNERPSLNMNIHGYHIEYYTAYEQHRAADGSYHTHPVQRTRTVTDFNFSLDLTGYVCPQWWRVAVIPSKEAVKKGEVVSLRDAIEQYTRSEKNIKDIVCQKQLLGWNFEELTGKIRSLIYSTGYRQHINVTFAVRNNRISARSSSRISRMSNSTLVRVLCVVSCLFLIFGPIYLCLRAAGSTRDRVVADYTMLTSADSFLQMNAAMIANAAVSRSREQYRAYLV